MKRIAITNIGEIISGDIDNPILVGDSVLIEDGKIAEIGYASRLNCSHTDSPLDAKGRILIPGLIDSHQHPGIGDYTPTRGVSMIGWIGGKVRAGVTTIISAGEVHLPGRPSDREGTKAMATYLHKSFSLLRPGGVKVHGGGLLLTPDLTESDFDELSKNGVWLVGEVCAPFSIPNPKIVAPLTKLAHKYGMKVQMHASGSKLSAEDIKLVDPDVVCHINGGLCRLRSEVAESVMVETDYFMEVVPCGNPKATQEIISQAKKYGCLDRIIIGSDDPGGLGFSPLGVLITLINISSMNGIPPEIALAMATGNTARAYGLNTGIIQAGREADLVLLKVDPDSNAVDALSSIEEGDMPIVSNVLVDGEVVV